MTTNYTNTSTGHQGNSEEDVVNPENPTASRWKKCKDNLEIARKWMNTAFRGIRACIACYECIQEVCNEVDL